MGGFLNLGYLQIMNFNRIFHYKPSILGYPIYGNLYKYVASEIISAGNFGCHSLDEKGDPPRQMAMNFPVMILLVQDVNVPAPETCDAFEHGK